MWKLYWNVLHINWGRELDPLVQHLTVPHGPSSTCHWNVSAWRTHSRNLSQPMTFELKTSCAGWLSGGGFDGLQNCNRWIGWLLFWKRYSTQNNASIEVVTFTCFSPPLSLQCSKTGISWTQICPNILAQLRCDGWCHTFFFLSSLQVTQFAQHVLFPYGRPAKHNGSLCHLHRCIRCLHCATWVTVHTRRHTQTHTHVSKDMQRLT